MAKIFRCFEDVKRPTYDFRQSHKEMQQEENRYLNDIRAKLNSMGFKGKNVGEVISFPVADSTADYMIVSMRPLKLMHLEIADAWDFEYAHLLTAKEVNEKIEAKKRLEKLFKS